MVPVKDKGRLVKVRIRLKTASILKKAVTKRELAIFAIMKNWYFAFPLPDFQTFWAKLILPKLIKVESRSQQHESFHFRMPGGV